jgi:paraquat-inducible protein B
VGCREEERVNEPREDVPEARVRAHRWIAWVWVVPIMAAIIVLWLAVRSFAGRGPEITITFKVAEGLQARQSTVRHRGVVVGTVEGLQLATDMSRVVVRARMARGVTPALNENTRFYIVTPRVGVEGISGLSTIVSGAYIEMVPGQGTKEQHAFTGLDAAPVLSPDTPGRSFTLRAAELGSLTRGSTISYRGVSVGEVETFAISPDGQGVTVTAFIRAPYDRLVHPETRFWNAGGIDVAVGAQGVRVRASSWQQLLTGGIAFETPTNALAGAASNAGATFVLYDDRPAAMRDPRGEQLLYIADFSGNLRGVDVGTAVELEGMGIGEVREARLSYDASRRMLTTLVTIAIDPERLEVLNLPRAAGEVTRKLPQEWIETLVGDGLRAQVTTANLLTGVKVVSLNMVKGAAPARVRRVGEYVQLPTTSSGDVTDILESLRDVLDNLDEATSGPELAHAIRSLDSTLTNLERLTSEVAPDVKSLIRSLRETSEAAQGAINSVNGLMGAGGAAAGDGPDLSQLMKQLTEAARSVRGLADYLDRHPEALLRGRRGGKE